MSTVKSSGGGYSTSRTSTSGEGQTFSEILQGGVCQKLEPLHGYCTVCRGEIPQGVQWTFTGMMQRVHADPDDCIAKLRPSVYQRFMKANPNYKSKDRY